MKNKRNVVKVVSEDGKCVTYVRLASKLLLEAEPKPYKPKPLVLD